MLLGHACGHRMSRFVLLMSASGLVQGLNRGDDGEKSDWR